MLRRTNLLLGATLLVIGVLLNAPAPAQTPVALEWIADCLCFLRDNGYSSIEASEEAERAWGQHVNDVANSTLFPKANSWYMGANVQGKHRQFMPYIGGVGPYRAKCDEVAAEGYTGFMLGGAEVSSAAG